MKTILAFARASIGSSAYYRGAIVVWMIITLVRAAVAIFIWLAAENQILGGYTKPEIISYFILIMFCDWILMWNPFHPIYQEIKSGQIVTYLVRPVSYLKSWFGREAGFKAVSMSVLITTGVLLLLLIKLIQLPLYLQPSWSWLFLILTVPGAIAISYLMCMCMALLAFWFTEIRYVNYLFWTLMPLLGGIFLPTSFLPGWLERLNWLLPFRYYLSLTMEIMLNRLSTPQALISLGILGLWIFFLYRIYRFMWREGVKAYTAFGQ